MKKYFIMSCLAAAVVLTPVCSAQARYHRGNELIAAAVGGAVVGLVGAVVHNTLAPARTLVVEPPVYTYMEPVPFIVREAVVWREPHYYRPVHHARRHYRH